jgi:hypothetical protein
VNLRAKQFLGRSLAGEVHAQLQLHVIRTLHFYTLYCGSIASWLVGNLEISISSAGGHKALPDGCLDFNIYCKSEQPHLPNSTTSAEPSMPFGKEWIRQKIIKKE